jgi:hypothetical protein
MTLAVRYPAEAPPWPAVRAALTAVSVPTTMRMIDGELAFPDEEPPTAWKELRIGTPGGMVSLRRTPAGDECVVWGNADAELRRSWQALAWACAAAGGGSVETAEGSLSAADFARAAGLGG